MRIGDLDLRERVLIIAEIGNNHEGDAGRARELVEGAARAGAHAVKFQIFRTDGFIDPAEERRHAQLRGYELGLETFAELIELARSRGLAVIATPFDFESAAFAEEAVDALKVASGDNTFHPLIHRLAASGKPLIISTGLAGIEEVRAAVRVVEEARGDRENLALLHCVSSYPTEPAEVNLRAIPYLSGELGVPVGYSDHALGIDACVLAVAAGARLVEKHFTLESIESDFRDHALSATEREMALMVERIGLAETMLGSWGKPVGEREAAAAPASRRSIAVADDLPAGHVLEPGDLIWVRPGGGLEPGLEQRLLGRALAAPARKGQRLTERDVSA